MVIKKPPKKFLLKSNFRRIKPMTDRDSKYMREMWGTTKLITDYGSLELREVVHDEKSKKMKIEENELFSLDSSWDYGLEPTVING